MARAMSASGDLEPNAILVVSQILGPNPGDAGTKKQGTPEGALFQK